MSLVLDEQKKLGIFFFVGAGLQRQGSEPGDLQGEGPPRCQRRLQMVSSLPLAVDRIVLFLVGVLVWKMLKRLVFLMPPVGSRRPITRS